MATGGAPRVARAPGELDRLSGLAPLHNPPAVQGIKAARKLLPGVAHAAVFDTAFFHDVPGEATTYARGVAAASSVR